MTTPAKVTAQFCKDKASEARFLKRIAESEPLQIMLEHIAETWDRMAIRLHETQ